MTHEFPTLDQTRHSISQHEFIPFVNERAYGKLIKSPSKYSVYGSPSKLHQSVPYINPYQEEDNESGIEDFEKNLTQPSPKKNYQFDKDSPNRSRNNGPMNMKEV